MGFGEQGNAGISPFVIGGLSGMGASAATHPIDLLKVRLQLSGESERGVKRTGMLKTGLLISQSEGFGALYKGLSASLLRQATYTTTRFGLYDVLKDSMSTKDASSFPFYKKVICSMLSGAGGSVIGTPADVIMVRMQADGRLPPEKQRKYKNVFDGLIRIVRNEGFVSMFKGCTPNVVRGMLMTAGQLASYDQAKQMMLQTGVFKADNISTHFGASLFAALVATTITSPVDVVKTRIMNDGIGAYTGSLQCFVKTFRNEGIGAFYKGYIPYFLRLGPHTIITFILVEQLTGLWSKVSGSSAPKKG